MTAELLNPATTTYTIDGVGPYTIDHGYGDITDFWVVARAEDGTLTTLVAGDDFTIAPEGPAASGAVTLEAATATLHDGAALHIRRATALEQGWSGQGARERGLEAALDRMTLAIQEAQRDAALSVRTFDIPTAPIAPEDGKGIYWDATLGRFVAGLALEDVEAAAGHAAAAAASETAAAASEAAS
ncbi:MAG: hypothetical protein KDK11_10225, partial [Maritimibacter sp.]|nr:hypothetical protein [Maritimibacter sp.]